MFKVFTNDGRQYVGGSAKLAEQFFAAAASAGRCVLMCRRVDGAWVDVKEHIA